MSEPTSEPTSEPINTREFRRQLDDVLRRRNPTALRDFLISAGQWDADNTPADIDRALWMMIAGSGALTDLHDEARRWLVDHGFTQEAQAILGRSGQGATQRATQRRRGSNGPRPASGQRAGTRQGPPPHTRGNQPGKSARGGASPNAGGKARGGEGRPPMRENRGPSMGEYRGPSMGEHRRPPDGQGRKP